MNTVLHLIAILAFGLALGAALCLTGESLWTNRAAIGRALRREPRP